MEKALDTKSGDMDYSPIFMFIWVIDLRFSTIIIAFGI